jgi:hypothetical protein
MRHWIRVVLAGEVEIAASVSQVAALLDFIRTAPGVVAVDERRRQVLDVPWHRAPVVTHSSPHAAGMEVLRKTVFPTAGDLRGIRT